MPLFRLCARMHTQHTHAPSLPAADPPSTPSAAQVGVDYVCESTGAFTTTEGCNLHVQGGAKKV